MKKEYTIIKINKNHQEINKISNDIVLNSLLIGILSLGIIVTSNNLIKNFNLIDLIVKLTHILFITGLTGYSISNLKDIIDDLSYKANLEKINNELFKEIENELPIEDNPDKNYNQNR